MSGFDQFDQLVPESRATLAFEGEPHEQLKRNLKKALKRHDELMDIDIGPDASVGAQRIVLDAATATVKAALTTDRTALKARSDNTLERVLLRLWFIKLQRGDEIKPEQVKMLRDAPRVEIEAALGPRLKDYDQMEW